MLIWQVAFFVVPLIFMVVITFWTVENFQMKADLTLENWVGILTAKYATSQIASELGTVGASSIGATLGRRHATLIGCPAQTV